MSKEEFLSCFQVNGPMRKYCFEALHNIPSFWGFKEEGIEVMPVKWLKELAVCFTIESQLNDEYPNSYYSSDFKDSYPDFSIKRQGVPESF